MKKVKFGLLGVALASIFAGAENAVSQMGPPMVVTGCDDSGACKDSGMAVGCSKSEGSPHRKCNCVYNEGGSINGGDLYGCQGIK